MPKRLERRLQAEARKRHFGKRRTAAYVFGTLSRLKQRQKRKRGKRRRQ